MRHLRLWLARLAGLLRHRHRDRDLEAEFASHLGMDIDDGLRRGLPPDEARRRAVARAGSIEAAKEAVRDQRGIPSAEALSRAVRHAARSLRRSPGYAMAIILSLALALGANTALFGIVHAVLLRPLPFADPSGLVAISLRNRHGSGFLQTDDVEAWRANAATLTGVATWTNYEAAVAGGAGAEVVRGGLATSGLLQVLGIRPALGRWFSPDEEGRGAPPVVVLSHALWQRQLDGDPAVVGRTLRIYRRDYTIVGVMSPAGALPRDAQFWIPGGDPVATQVVARRRPEARDAAILQDLERLAPSIERQRSRDLQPSLHLAPLADTLNGPARTALPILLGAVGLVLLLGCLNAGNLALARTFERRRELAVRATLGAGRGSLALHVVAENVILVTAGAAAGALLAVWITRVLVALSPVELLPDRGIRLTSAALAFAGGVAVLVTLLVSLAPAADAMRTAPQPLLGQGGERTGRDRRARQVRRVLVASQLAMALMLLTGAGLLTRSLAGVLRADMGFDPNGVVIATVNVGLTDLHEDTVRARRLYDDLRLRLAALPGVRQVALGPAPLVAGRANLRDGFHMIFTHRGPDSASVTVWVKHIDPGYVEALRIPMRAGRGLDAADRAGAAAVALVNDAAARLFFQRDDPIGRILTAPKQLSDGQPITVVGVVHDVRQRDVAMPAEPEIFVPAAQQRAPWAETMVIRTSGDPALLLPLVRRVLRDADPNLATTRLTTMNAVVDSSLARFRFMLLVLGAFAAVAISLAMLGLYAVVAYLVTQRTREIGVRVALGAQRRDVLGLVFGESARLLAIGGAAGLLAAWYLTGVLREFLYGVEPRDAATFGVAFLVLAAVASFASIVPAARAARIDPVVTLREE